MKAIDARAIRTTGFSISVHILSYEYVLCIKLLQRIHVMHFVMHLQQNTIFALKTVNDCKTSLKKTYENARYSSAMLILILY